MLILEEAIFNKQFRNPVYIVLMHSGTKLANAIKRATNDEFSHACISFNANLDPLYSFGTKGKNEKGAGFSVSDPKDKFFVNHKATYSVYVMYVSDRAYAAMQDRLEYFKKNNVKLKYDFLGLLNIYFGKDSEDHTNKYFCSRFVMEIINQAMKLEKVPSLWKPQDILNLSNISCIQKGSNFFNYDSEKAIKICNDIKNGLYNPNNITHESASGTIEKNYNGSGDSLSKYTKMKLSDAMIMQYKSNYSTLNSVKINKDTNGYIWVDEREVVAIVNVTEDKDGIKWITTMEIFGLHKGKGLAKELIKVATGPLRATNITVSRSNEIAIKALKHAGFKIYKSTESSYMMSRERMADDEDDEDINESFTLPDSSFNISDRFGFYGDDNIWNDIVVYNGKNYRNRVECLILKDDMVFVAKNDKGEYIIPGGSVEKDITDIQQVENECKEEARILVKDVEYTGLDYMEEYKDIREDIKQSPNHWVGSYTRVYVAKYAGMYTGYIDPRDVDNTMIRGEFVKISSIIDKLKIEWFDALAYYR